MERANLSDKNNQVISEQKQLNLWAFYCFALLVAIFALLPRLDSYKYFFGKYLWAEDGNVFLNQSQELGLSAIIKPYAGYLHVYPRLITEISQLFDFLYQPTILLLGWFFAYCVLVHSLARSMLQQNVRMIFLAPLVALVSLQPNYGEVFFNITNSQWMLGGALFLYILADSNKKKNQWIRSIFLFILTLTGPFSLILVPVLLLKIALKKDWHDQKPTYLIVFLGASIQLIALLSSERISSGTINRDPWEWIVPFIKMASFGANSVWTIFASLIIWSSIIYLIFSIAYKNKSLDSVVQTAMFLLIAAFSLIFAGLFSHKHSPAAIVALGSGNRYTWVPYALILVSAILLSSSRKLFGGIIIVFFGFICYTNFNTVKSPDLQFEAFSKFSRLESVFIPIHPQLPTFPGWHIAGKPLSTIDLPTPVEVKLMPEGIVTSGLKTEFSSGILEMVSTGSDPILVLTNKIPCSNHSHAGININLTRKKEGWMQIFWSAKESFNERQSFRRWYPPGSIKAQFAFPTFPSGTYLRFDPMEDKGFASIEKIELYCL